MEKIITFLLFCYLTLFPFGQLNRLPLGVPEVNVYLTDIILLLLVAGWGVWRIFSKRKKALIAAPLTSPILLFLFLACCSLLVNSPLLLSREVVIAGLYLLRLIVYFGFYFVLFSLKKWLNPKEIFNYLLVIGFASSAFGLIQYWQWPDLRALAALEWDPHYYRVVGTFLDPGFAGIIYALFLIDLVVIKWEQIFTSARRSKIWIFVFFVGYIALALTYSRSSYLAFIVGMGVIAFVKKSPKFFLGILALGILTLLILPRQSQEFIGEGTKLGRRFSIIARINNWKQAIAIAKENPLFGVGFNAYRYAQKDYGFLKNEWQETHSGAGADSSFLFVLATTGIVGFLSYFYLWLRIIQLSWKRSLVVFASACCLLVHSWFLNTLFYPWVMGWLAIILATL